MSTNPAPHSQPAPNSGRPQWPCSAIIRSWASAQTTSAGASPPTPASPADNLGIHAHDQYLETLADTGLLGLATLLWLWLGVARVALAEVREERGDWPWRAALMASLAAWAVHAVLDDFERFWPTSIAFWLIVGLTVCRPRQLLEPTSD